MRVDNEASFLCFVYPFRFNSSSRLSRVDAIESAEWMGRELVKFRVWSPKTFSEEDLLTPVARLVNQNSGSWHLSTQALESVQGGMGGGKNKSHVVWSLITPHGEIPFQIEEVQLALFDIGLGFVTIRISAVQAAADVSGWLDLLHYFRFSNGQREVALRARERGGHIGRLDDSVMTAFFPEPAGGLRAHPSGTGVLDHLLDGLLKTARVSSDDGIWWCDVFARDQWIPYVALYVDDIPGQEIPTFLYRIRNFFHAKQEIFTSKYDLSLDHPFLMPYSDKQWFFFSLEGGGFVACNAPTTEFVRHGLPDHLAKQYFLIFLIVLQQRFALNMLLDEVASNWKVGRHEEEQVPDSESLDKTFDRIHADLMTFTAHGYFAQAMQHENHHRCYRKWQEVFQVGRLYEEVSDEIRYMAEYLRNRHDRRLAEAESEQEQRSKALGQRLDLITWLFGVPLLALSYLSAVGGVSALMALVVLAGSLATALILFYLLRWLSSRS